MIRADRRIELHDTRVTIDPENENGSVRVTWIRLNVCLLSILLTRCSLHQSRETAGLTRASEPHIPVLPAQRHGHRLHVVGDELFVLGGFSYGSARFKSRRATDVYSFADDTWRRLPDMNKGRSFFSSAVIDGKIYAIGTGIERFDPTKRIWESVLKDGLPRSHFAAAAVGKRIFVVGGFPVERSKVWVFDIESKKLERLDPFPGFHAGDHFHIVVQLDGALHVIGGLDRASKKAHWVLGVDGWTRRANAPVPLWSKFAVQAVIDEKLFIFTEEGGWRYNPKSSQWSKLAAMKGMLGLSASFVRGRRIYVLGGLAVGRTPRPIYYDIELDRWMYEEKTSTSAVDP